MGYADALAIQRRHQGEVIEARGGLDPAHGVPSSCRSPGRILLVEHGPVVTITARAGVRDHLLATPELLSSRGVDLCETDRGGDITYHGPGQVVAYPILDLNLLNLGLHEHMSMMESAVIAACASFGVQGCRDPAARGVWARSPTEPGVMAKVCAMGVRVRRWVSMHGLALNVSPDMDHFALIVPCGLAGRPVTSLATILGARCPSVTEVRVELARQLVLHVREAFLRAKDRVATEKETGR